MKEIANKIKRIVSVIYSLIIRKTEGAVILTYHSVCPDGESFLSVSPEDFEIQMRYIRERNWNIISLLELFELVNQNFPIPDKTVVITFDDACKDNLTYAMPIMEKYKIPVTLFVPSGLVGGSMTTREGCLIKLMDWNELRIFNNSNLVTIGSHTDSHPILTNLDEKVVKSELSKSKKRLEEELDINCVLFAYPKGRNDKQVQDMVKKYYKAAVVTASNRVSLDSKVYILPRRGVFNYTSFIKFIAILFER